MIPVPRNFQLRHSLHQLDQGTNSRRKYTSTAETHLLRGSVSLRPNSNSGLPPMSREPHTDIDSGPLPKSFMTSRNPMTHYNNDATTGPTHALAKQSMHVRTSSAPVGGQLAATRGGILSKATIRPNKYQNRFNKSRAGDLGMFANGAHLSGKQKKTEALENHYSDVMETKRYVRPPSAQTVLQRATSSTGVQENGLSLEERQRVNSRRPNTAPTVSPNTKQNEDLTRENARLHEEMASMRDSLFRKMRGGKRFVSGGGFRTGGTPQHERNDNKQSGQKNENKHLRNKILQLQNEKHRVEQSLAETNLKLKRLSEQVRVCQSSAKSSDELVIKLREIIKDREKTISIHDTIVSELKCERKNLENLCNSQKLEITNLKNALASVEKGNASPIKIREPDPDTEAALVAAKAELISLHGKLQKTMDEKDSFKHELKLVESKNGELKTELKASCTVQALLEKQAKESNEQLRIASDTISEQRNELNDLNQWKILFIEKMRAKDDKLLELQNRIDFLQKEFDLHKKQSSGAHGDMEKSFMDEIEVLKKEIQRLRNLLEEENEKRSQVLAEKESIRKICDGLEKLLSDEKEKSGIFKEQLREASGEIDRLRKELNALKIELDQKKRNARDYDTTKIEMQKSMNEMKASIERLRDELSEAQRRGRSADGALSKEQVAHGFTKDSLKRSENNLGLEKVRANDLQAKLDEANRQLSGVQDLINKAKQEAKKEALEKTLQSMVRLCVVAPTVNVHFNNQQASCKAPMPSSRIKHIIQDDVLPNFTSLFLQMEEGVSANGNRLDAWLEEMLAEMQKSIQAHLQDVFNNDAPSSAALTSGRGGRPDSRQSKHRR